MQAQQAKKLCPELAIVQVGAHLLDGGGAPRGPSIIHHTLLLLHCWLAVRLSV
jgi:hypothetical protein